MKWIDGFFPSEKDRRKKKWHQRFAWFPKIVGETEDHRKIKVWMCFVSRRGQKVRYFGPNGFYEKWEWEYKENERF